MLVFRMAGRADVKVIMVSHLPPCAPATTHMTRSSWCHLPWSILAYWKWSMHD